MRTERPWLAPIAFGVWFGLVGGLLEVLTRLIRPIAERGWFFGGAHLYWMPAAAHAVLFGLLGALLAPMAHAWPRALGPARLAALFSGIVWLDLAWLFAPPRDLYALLVAAFLAWPTAWLVRRWETSFRRLVSRSLPLLLLGPPAAGLGIERARARVEAHAWERPPATGRPNVLLLVPDSVRASHLSAYGYFRSTSPTLERLAARGVRFERATAAAPWTLPSVAAMFTGRYLHEQQTGWFDPLDARWPTLAERLVHAGYVTGGFVANEYLARGSGIARGFDHYEDYPVSWPQALWTSTLVQRLTRTKIGSWSIGEWKLRGKTQKSAARLTDDFLAWHARRRGPHPWFGYLQFMDAHLRPHVPAEYEALFTNDSARRPVLPQRLPPELAGQDPKQLHPRAAHGDRYDRALRYVDDQIGRLLAELERRGDLARTIVIVASDHGEEFDEHGPSRHGDSLYYPALAVPLVLAGPGEIPAGRRVTPFVSLRDLPATVEDVVGLDGPSRFPGASLARHWRSAPAPRPEPVIAELNYAWNKPAWLPISKGNMTSVLLGTHHLIRRGDGQQELYDVGRDPWEQEDRSADPALSPVVAELSRLLDQLPPIRRGTGAPSWAVGE